MSETFNTFLSQLSETNATLDYYVDFGKVNTNVKKIALKLNQLNYLIGKNDLKAAVNELYEENSKVFEILDILIAVRTKDKKKAINKKGEFVLIERYFKDVDLIYEYIVETGLGEIFKNKNITNLVDYVFGVEVGLDTNARKNRGGTNMEKIIADVFSSNDIVFEEQVSSKNLLELDSLGEDIKIFDFAITTKHKTYLIETNFYNGGGSKLNEVARAYSDLAPKINKYPQYEFVWITDGKGWLSAKNKLEEAFSLIPKIYNLVSIKDFLEIVEKDLV
ncbi:MAG: type II restriction endonuclease [Bacteroidales bacterium]